MSICRADNCYAAVAFVSGYCHVHEPRGALTTRIIEDDDGLTKAERVYLEVARGDARAVRRRRNKAAAAASFATAMGAASLAIGTGGLGVVFFAGLAAGIYFLFGAEDES